MLFLDGLFGVDVLLGDLLVAENSPFQSDPNSTLTRVRTSNSGEDGGTESSSSGGVGYH